MGLLERALLYKQGINKTGKETLIDKIKGPAETDLNKAMLIETVDISEIDQIENTLNDELTPELKDNHYLKSINYNKENENTEEDIILFNENDYFLDSPEAMQNVKPSNAKLYQKINDEIIINSDKEIEIIENNSSDSVIPDTNLKSHDDYNFEMPEFNDFGTLFEIQKEFIKSDTIEEIYSTIIFSIMGQLGVSSVSIISPSSDDPQKWIIADSHGIKVSDNDIFWSLDKGILHILSTYRGVLDIEDLKHDSNLREDYYKFIAVDTRIITPLQKEDILIGAILVGEKINSEEFTTVELEFLRALSDISSAIIESISKLESVSTELYGLRIEKEILSDVEFFQDSLLNVSSLKEIEEVIKKNFYSLGLESYCLFLKDPSGAEYYPAYYDESDSLDISNSGFRIKHDNRLITFLTNKKNSIILENFNESSVVIDTFGRNRILKMEMFIAYPFIIAGKLSGFITIFKINPAVDITDIDIRIQKINKFLVPYLYRIYELDPEYNKFNDLTTTFYERIEYEITHANELNIPVSIILFSIKNYKRFYDRFGKIELEKLTNYISEFIKSKLNIGDFSARIDRNSFMVVLPGKEKRYSIMFSNSIKKEIIEKYNMSDFKLLITSLNSVFPEDGKDLFSILEILE